MLQTMTGQGAFYYFTLKNDSIAYEQYQDVGAFTLV